MNNEDKVQMVDFQSLYLEHTRDGTTNWSEFFSEMSKILNVHKDHINGNSDWIEGLRKETGYLPPE